MLIYLVGLFMERYNLVDGLTLLLCLTSTPAIIATSIELLMIVSVCVQVPIIAA